MSAATGGAGASAAAAAAAAPYLVPISDAEPIGSGIVFLHEVAGAAGAAAAAAAALAPGKYILVGKESKYCTDVDEDDRKAAYDAVITRRGPAAIAEARAARDAVPPFFTKMRNPAEPGAPFFTEATFLERQRFVLPAGTAAGTSDTLLTAKVKFTERLTNIMRINPGIILRHDTPLLRSDGSYTTNFRYLPASFKYGIIKGSREKDSSKRFYVEDPIRTISREFREEVGTDFNPRPLLQFPGLSAGYKIFFTTTKDQAPPGKDAEFTRSFIEDKIRGRTARHYGELFDLEFMKTDEIMTKLDKFNIVSIEVLTYMHTQRMMGGSRTRRNRRRNRKQRRQSRK